MPWSEVVKISILFPPVSPDSFPMILAVGLKQKGNEQMSAMEGSPLTVLQASLSDFRLLEAALDAAASAAFIQLLRYKSMATRQPPRAGG